MTGSKGAWNSKGVEMGASGWGAQGGSSENEGGRWEQGIFSGREMGANGREHGERD
jgi:hypothetical protein